VSGQQPPQSPPEPEPKPEAPTASGAGSLPEGTVAVPQPGPLVLPPALLAQLLAGAQQLNLPYAGAAPVTFTGLPIATSQTQIQLRQGLFPPDEMERYEKLLPGVFDRVIKMAEKAQSAQVAAINQAQDYTQRDTRRGHWLGFATAALAILGACACVGAAAIFKTGSGAYWVGALMVGVPVMAVAKALIDSARAGMQPGTDLANSLRNVTGRVPQAPGAPQQAATHQASPSPPSADKTLPPDLPPKFG
jgi:uncharacterized membrane protein